MLLALWHLTEGQITPSISRSSDKKILFNLYSIITHFDPLKYHIDLFEIIMENGANVPFSFIFVKSIQNFFQTFLEFFQCCLKTENDVMI